MFRYKRLTFAILLTGCTTQASDTPFPETTTTDSILVMVDPNEELLTAVDATLDVADQAIDEILEQKAAAENTINSLQGTIRLTNANVSNLGGEVAAKDSLILAYDSINNILIERITDIESNLEHATHKCTTECFPTMEELTQEREALLSYIDSLQNEIIYLDSLVTTNKRLNKKYEVHRTNI